MGTTPTASADTLTRSGWHLIWHDEFDRGVVDMSKWRVEDAALDKNDEQQYYTPEDVYVSKGRLVLRSQKREMGGRPYTSGLVETLGLFEQAYGRFEIRAKLPRGQGIWPAHWMLPADGTWPPEIDIMEMLGHEPREIHMSLHSGKLPNKITQTDSFIEAIDYSRAFHTFAVEWSPNDIRWFVDGRERFEVTKHVPRKPFYIILNTAVGGDWPGMPDETTVFPQYHEIDYVRVYAKDIEGFYYLTTAAENGLIEANPRKTRLAANTKVELTAKPMIGYRFSRWDGDITSAKDNPTKLLMNKHRQVRAIFEPDRHAPQLLSEGKPTQASSVEKEWLQAANAVDGDKNTRWASVFDDAQWLSVDLGDVYTIEAIRLNWEAAYGMAYDLQVSGDGETWENVYTKETGSGRVEEITDINKRARYVRLNCRKRGTEWGYSLWEFQVFGRE